MAGSSRKGMCAAEVEWGWDEREMKRRWEMFAKFGAPTATEITGKNFDKWLKDAKILDPKGKFFSHRILSRDECFDSRSKTANLS